MPALIASVVSDRPQAPAVYKQRLEGIAGLSHVTVEVHRLRGALSARRELGKSRLHCDGKRPSAIAAASL